MRDEPVMLSREQWAEVSEELNTLRARVAELEDKCQRFQMAAMDNRNWCQAAESQLARLREGLEGLVEKWRESADRFTWANDAPTYRLLAEELQSLLTDNTPTDNSGGVVDGGGV